LRKAVQLHWIIKTHIIGPLYKIYNPAKIKIKINKTNKSKIKIKIK